MYILWDILFFWFCGGSHILVCNSIYVSSFLSLNMFQLSPNSVKLFFNVIPLDVFFVIYEISMFIVFIDFDKSSTVSVFSNCVQRGWRGNRYGIHKIYKIWWIINYHHWTRTSMMMFMKICRNTNLWLATTCSINVTEYR